MITSRKGIGRHISNELSCFYADIGKEKTRRETKRKKTTKKGTSRRRISETPYLKFPTAGRA